MSKEVWKPIKKANGFYEISSLGRLRRSKPSKHTWKTYVGKILKPQYNKNYVFNILNLENNKKIIVYIHQIVLEEFAGSRPKNMCANHKNGNKLDNRVSNLEYVTFKENKLHSTKILKKGIGEKHGNSKLTNEMVKEIRETTYKRGDDTILSKKFNVHLSLIGMVRKNKIWTHI